MPSSKREVPCKRCLNRLATWDLKGTPPSCEDDECKCLHFPCQGSSRSVHNNSSVHHNNSSVHHNNLSDLTLSIRITHARSGHRTVWGVSLQPLIPLIADLSRATGSSKETTPTYTPEQLGLSEVANDIIAGRIRSTAIDQKLQKELCLLLESPTHG